MATKTRDFASAGADAAMRGRTTAKGGLHLVKTISRASESARDRRGHDANKNEQEPAPRPDNTDFSSATPEQRAYETVNFVLRTLGNRLGAAGLVALPSLDRALTSSTAAVLFSAEASPLFESLRAQAHDLVLVNSVFCAIYFIGFVTARLAGTVPKYNTGKSGPIGTKVIEELFHAAIGEEATKGNLKANLAAYKTLVTATGLLQPTNSGPGIFPGFPVLKQSAYSNDGFFKTRANLKDFDDLVEHFGRNGFPQPLSPEEELPPSSPADKKPRMASCQIKDWKFLSGDDNTRDFEVTHADRHIGEKFGRVMYWLICSAHRLQPGQAVIAYHQQHIQLVRWLGNRFGYRVLSAAEDLDWSGKHYQLNDKLKAIMRDWLIIVPAPKSSKRSSKRGSKLMQKANDANQLASPMSPRSTPEQQEPRETHKEKDLKSGEDAPPLQYSEDGKQKQVLANSKEVRRPVRGGRSVSFATDDPMEPLRLIKTNTSSESPARTPLRSALKQSISNSPPRPPRPAESDIPDMRKVDQSHRRSLILEKEEDKATPMHRRRSSGGSIGRQNIAGAGLLPPFVSDMSNGRSSTDSEEVSRRHSRSASSESGNTISRPVTRGESEVGDEFGTPPEIPSSPKASPADELSAYPGALYAMTREDSRQARAETHIDAPPKIPAKSPRRQSNPSTPERESPPDIQNDHHPAETSVARTPSRFDRSGVPDTLASPTMGGTATPWEDKSNVAAFSGIADTLVRPRPGSTDEKTIPGDASFPSTRSDHAVDSKSEQRSRPGSFAAPSTDSSLNSAAPSWPSSIASIPSSVPGTPTGLAPSSVSSTNSGTQVARSATSNSRRKAPPPPKRAVYATALYDFSPTDPKEEISMREGGSVEVIERSHELEQDGWIRVKIGEHSGLVPVAYLDVHSPVLVVTKDGDADSQSRLSHLISNPEQPNEDEEGSNAHLHFHASWIDLDASEFPAEDFSIDDSAPLTRLDSSAAALSDLGQHSRKSSYSMSVSGASTSTTATAKPMGGHSRTASAIRARIWNAQEGFLGLDASPASSRPTSSYASSVAWSAVPDPLTLSSQSSRRAKKLPKIGDDGEETPRQEAPGGKQRAYEYFETASQAGSSAGGSVRSRGSSNSKRSSASIQSPRFWDDVSGTIGINPAEKLIEEDEEEEGDDDYENREDNKLVKAGKPAPRDEGAVISTHRDAEDQNNDDGDDGASTPRETKPQPQPPRFWDDVSGAIVAAPSTSSKAAPKAEAEVMMTTLSPTTAKDEIKADLNDHREQAVNEPSSDVATTTSETEENEADPDDRPQTSWRDSVQYRPRFWDDVSGMTSQGGSASADGGCRQS